MFPSRRLLHQAGTPLPVLSWLQQQFSNEPRTPKDVQQRLDTERARALTDEWREATGGGGGGGGEGGWAAVARRLPWNTADDPAAALERNLTLQLREVLTKLADLTSPEAHQALQLERARGGALRPDPNTFPSTAPARSGPPGLPGSPSSPSSLRDMVEDAARERLGFSVRVAPSDIAGAGMGAWLEGRAGAGAVVGLYPGTVFLPGQLLRDSVLEWLYPDDHCFLFSRYDGVLIDARETGVVPISPAETAERGAFRRRITEGSGKVFTADPDKTTPGLLGAGHMCNHPPPTKQPNVMAVSYDFASAGFGAPNAFPSELLGCVPNTYARAPSILDGTYSPSVAMHSVLLLSTRPLQDEELFIDYRLTPGFERPLWYEPVDPEEDERRWSASAIAKG